MDFQHRQLLITADGSPTLALPGSGVTYHSKHGAVQESMHVFIEAGLRTFISQNPKKSIHLLEAGWGTGLNSLLTWIVADRLETLVEYEARELFPLAPDEYQDIHYEEMLDETEAEDKFRRLHEADWEMTINLSPYFSLKKINADIQAPANAAVYDLIYFDAFAPGTQPELWTTEVFANLFQSMRENGILVTYCSKGDVRRAMISAGFSVEKIPGPPGKREILRATKLL